MNLSELLEKKSSSREALKTKFDLPKRSKVLIAVHFSNPDFSTDIIEGLSILPANFILFGTGIKEHSSKNLAFGENHSNLDTLGIDAFFCNCSDVKLEKIMKDGVVPIVNEGNYLGKITQEFHPGRAEGNSYLYEKDSSWSAYYALVRYLENMKFPYDNRNLVKNVVGL